MKPVVLIMVEKSSNQSLANEVEKIFIDVSLVLCLYTFKYIEEAKS